MVSLDVVVLVTYVGTNTKNHKLRPHVTVSLYPKKITFINRCNVSIINICKYVSHVEAFFFLLKITPF